MSQNISAETEEALSGLDTFKQFLIDVAEQIQSAKSKDGSYIIDNEARALAAKAQAQVDTTMTELAKIALNQDADHLQSFTLEKVWALAGWAFALGQMDGGSPSSERFKEFERAQHARHGKIEKDAEGKRKAIELIQATPTFKAKKGPAGVSAEAVLLEVGGKLSLATIRRRLTDMRSCL